ncbi:discoidin domain-containing protein [Thalassotalea sp. PS06]|uniref:galactose-binding domain-containing protein n=1 Tax=Thalassotalea sp. PS06 TaxID=2594005 RepID=UPI00163DB906|nr:discoidin domain-containing protein [Thalassotalea sp. PS06]
MQYNSEEMKTEYEKVVSYLKDSGPNLFKGVRSDKPLIINTHINARFIKLRLQAKDSFQLDSIKIIDKNGQNVSSGGNTIISSFFNDLEKYDGRNFLARTGDGGCGFHTKNEDNPWLVIDLKDKYSVEQIIINNRDDNFYKRALSLCVESSGDLTNWTTIYDNWQYIKQYKNGQRSEFENCLLYASSFCFDKTKPFVDKLKKLGRDTEALVAVDYINKIVSEEGIAIGPHGFTETFGLASVERKEQVYSELSKLLHLLNEKFQVPAFVSSGTLLGIVRDGQLIAHDDDLDICYISQEVEKSEILREREEIVDFLDRNGYQVKNSNVAHLWCRSPSGIMVDIFTGFIEEGFCSMNPFSKKD